jgi:hypothetical protein
MRKQSGEGKAPRGNLKAAWKTGPVPQESNKPSKLSQLSPICQLVQAKHKCHVSSLNAIEPRLDTIAITVC